MRKIRLGASCGLWLLLRGPIGAPGAVHAQPEAGAQAEATTIVRRGEDCQAVVRRVYGNAAGAMARFHLVNPQLGSLPHQMQEGAAVNTPPLRQRRDTAEAARLSYVSSAVRTKTRHEGWTEALPDQPIDRRMRIHTGQSGGAEVNLKERTQLQLDPNATLVVDSLPRGHSAGTVRLLEGTLRAGVEASPLLVRTPAADLRLHGGVRIESEGGDRASVAVYEGSAAVRARGREISVPADQGTLIEAGRRPQEPRPLLPAPVWNTGEPEARLIAAFGSLGDAPAPLRGAAVLPFHRVPGAEQYLFEIARDERFNDRHAGGAIVGPPHRQALAPGLYLARVSAMDGRRLLGPPSTPLRLKVVALRSDAILDAGAPVPVLRRRERATLLLHGGGRPLLACIDDGAEVDCSGERRFLVGPGGHRLTLSLQGARAEVQLSVTPAAAPKVAQARPSVVEPPELPVPLLTPGFPAQSLLPRSRVYALFGFGSARSDRAAEVYRLDLGGEVAFRQRFSADVNLPLFYQDDGPRSGAALGDVSFGLRAVAYQDRRVAVGPILRVQLPTGTFDRGGHDVDSYLQPGTHPVVLDPKAAVGVFLGPVGLLSTQGAAAVLAIPNPQALWAMSYAAQARFGWLSLGLDLDGAIGLIDGSRSGAALGGGLRLHLSRWRLLLGARGGLGEGGQEVFGRYFVSAGAEWVR